MDLYYIDYISVFGGSWMHRLPAKVKMISLAVVILLMLSVQSVHLLSATVSAVLIIAVTARLPMKIVLALMLYPSLFLVVILLSINGLTIIPALALVLRVPHDYGRRGRLLSHNQLPGHIQHAEQDTAGIYSSRTLFLISFDVCNHG